MTSDSLDIAETIKKGKDLHFSGRLKAAGRLYNQVLSADPWNFDALFLGGVLAHQAGQPENAAAMLTRAAEIKPLSPEVHVNLAAASTALGRYDDALAAGYRALELQSDLPEAYVNIGLAHDAKGRHEEAVGAYRQALEIRSANPGAENNLGVALSNLGRRDDAVDAFTRALTLKPDYPDALNNLGAALVEMDRLAEAETAARRALELRPNYADAWNTLGAALRGAEKHDDALAAFERALELQPGNTAALCNLGNTLNLLNRPQEAVPKLERVLEIDPALAEAQNGLGNAFEFLGRIPEAVALYRRAIELKPGYSGAYMQLVPLLPPAEAKALIPALEHSLERADPGTKARMQLCYALGRARDGARDYDGAFDAYAAGNRLKRQTLNYDVAKDEALMRRIEGTFDAAYFDARGDGGCKSEVPVLIIGMPRSGTSMVEQILASHSQVFGAGELNDLLRLVHGIDGADGAVYPETFAILSDEELEALGAAYAEGLSARAPEAAKVIDKLPNNFLYMGAVRAILPRAKIIHCVRDPMDTCLSCHNLLFLFAQHYCYDLDELGRFYKSYSRLMAHFHRALPGWILDVRYEDVIEHQERETRRMLEFLELPWENQCLSFHETQRSVQTASSGQVRQPLYKSSIARWKRYQKHLGPLRNALGPIVEER